MKATLHVVAAAALMSVVTAMPAFADGPRASGHNTVAPMLQPQPAGAMTPSPHYEWQHHYVGHHARFEGYWALVN